MQHRSISEASPVEAVRVEKASRRTGRDMVAAEALFTLSVNGTSIVSLACTPRDLEDLAAGFLLSQRLIATASDLKCVTVRGDEGLIEVETTKPLDASDVISRIAAIGSGCGAGAFSLERVLEMSGAWRIQSELSAPATAIFELMRTFQRVSELFRSTGGVHGAALCDSQRLILHRDDIGRHNAVDKAFGRCLLADIPTRDRVLLTTGRVSSDILVKTALREIPILVSRSAPTSLAVELASKVGMTLVGFARGERLNIYANDWRIA